MCQIRVALTGDRFFLCWPNGNNRGGSSSETFRQQFQHPRHIHHTYVALDESDSYFIQFLNDKTGTHHITWSLPAYPGLGTHIQDNYEGDIECVALGENGHYFFRDSWGSAWSLPESIEDHLKLDDETDPVVKLWLGKDDAYYAELKSGASR